MANPPASSESHHKRFGNPVNQQVLSLAINRFDDCLPSMKIHEDYIFYHSVSGKAHSLEQFSNNYKKFFVKVNGEYIEDVELLVSSQYHNALIKPESDYVMQKHTNRDADRAIRYFALYAQFIDGALFFVEDLMADLNKVERENRYVRLWMRMD